MKKETISKAAELLQQACTILLSIGENLTESNSRTTSHRPATNVHATQVPVSSPTLTAAPGLRETLERAKSMMASSSAGLYKRLNQNERFRQLPENLSDLRPHRPIQS